MQAAENGDRTMLVWLGKQWLGQTDTQRTEHTGRDGGPIEHVTVDELDREIARLEKELASSDAPVRGD
jgi:hypothetical protein